MNAQKFTQKSLLAIQQAQDTALSYGQMQIEEIHLLHALLTQEEGLIPQLITKMGKDPAAFTKAVEEAIRQLPSVSGPGREAGKIYVSQAVDRALNEAESLAASMNDDYVSVEHLFLSLLDHPDDEVKKLWHQFNIKKDDFLQALSSVRGNTRVTSDSPEGTYDALKRYGTDLVERARTKNWTRSSAVMRKSAMSSASCRGKRKITGADR